jgi:NADPH-dependent curcumin reductase CurA
LNFKGFGSVAQTFVGLEGGRSAWPAPRQGSVLVQFSMPNVHPDPTPIHGYREEIAMTETVERIVLASRPVGEPTLDNFRLEELPIPKPGPGQMLLRTLWLSLDPYMRGRMSDAPSYAKPVGIGDVMEGGAVSEVVGSNVARFAKGDIVMGRTGWQTHALSDGSSLQKVDPTRAPIQTALGVLGMPGMTAYMGLLEIGKPAAGETVVVAAASGAVGSVVGQIARVKDSRAVGIAGGPDKCRYVTQELGFDACIDHRAPDFAARLATACPKGIDVYFERRRNGIRGRVSTAQSVRPHSGVRVDLHVQRLLAITRPNPSAALDASNPD